MHSNLTAKAARMALIAVLGLAFDSYSVPLIQRAIPGATWADAQAGGGSGKDKMNWAKRRRDWCKKNDGAALCSYIMSVKEPKCWKTNIAHYKNACPL